MTKNSVDNQTEPSIGFDDLNLPNEVLRAVRELGYEQPSPIQAQSIPSLLSGKDILGQAQTGTGKTAAFALPLLSTIDPKQRAPQLLILTPTRELAIQVAEACQQYAKYLSGIQVLPIYGGQSYTIQLNALRRGVQLVVGTPGRVMDHMRRGTLKLDDLKALVLDEADEMLRMGFIDDVKWVLEQSPDDRQIALFSATMPKEVQKVADQHLNNPAHIRIAAKEATNDSIDQSYWVVRGTNKLDAITRILEHEDTDGVIVFVRTKNSTIELADRLAARGLRSEALNGDIPQANREKVITRLKNRKLDILIATDVAARGLDVDRISHVINYDVPYDAEAYIHRIGRTGRAGRQGKAILFISPREKRMLRHIERATKKEISPMELPSTQEINQNRIARFKDKIINTLETENLDFFSQIISELQHQHEVSSEQIAAALGHIAQGDSPLLLKEGKFKDTPSAEKFTRETDSRQSKPRQDKPAPEAKATPLKDHEGIEMRRFWLAPGRRDGVTPRNIVGAIANEAEIESQYIGTIEIRHAYSTVDLPADMPKEIMALLRKVHVVGRQLGLKHYDPNEVSTHAEESRAPNGKKSKTTKGRASKGASNSKKAKPKWDKAKRKRKERKQKKS